MVEYSEIRLEWIGQSQAAVQSLGLKIYPEHIIMILNNPLQGSMIVEWILDGCPWGVCGGSFRRGWLWVLGFGGRRRARRFHMGMWWILGRYILGGPLPCNSGIIGIFSNPNIILTIPHSHYYRVGSPPKAYYFLFHYPYIAPTCTL